MKEKIMPLLTVVLYGACAVIWIANCVRDAQCGQLFGLLGGLQVVCAVAWCVLFCARLFRYIRDRK